MDHELKESGQLIHIRTTPEKLRILLVVNICYSFTLVELGLCAEYVQTRAKTPLLNIHTFRQTWADNNVSVNSQTPSTTFSKDLTPSKEVLFPAPRHLVWSQD